METGKRKMENEERDSERETLSVINYPISIKKICSACGAKVEREAAKFCLVCGKFLSEDYQPLDSLRASYRLQGKSFPIEKTQSTEVENLFLRNENSFSDTARACLVYSLVPYVGILFVPLAIAAALFGAAVSFYRPKSGGRKLAFVSIVLSFIVTAIQVFLWWLLYFIPEIGKQI